MVAAAEEADIVVGVVDVARLNSVETLKPAGLKHGLEDKTESEFIKVVGSAALSYGHECLKVAALFDERMTASATRRESSSFFRILQLAGARVARCSAAVDFRMGQDYGAILRQAWRATVAGSE